MLSRPLLAYAGQPDWYRAPMLSPTEIMVGPKYQTQSDSNGYRTIQTPAGEFDMAKLVAGLGEGQKPDALVVQVNRSAQTIARNLYGFAGPKVLAVGDTHHMQNPVSFALEYAASESFDAIILEFTRQHAHWFSEAGFDAVHWLPLFSVNPRERVIAETQTAGVAMIGAMGKYHPYRQHVIAGLQQAGVPVGIAQLPQSDATDVYAKTAISLNVSLNGDLNLRCVEVLAAGGCLLTDQLAPQAGLDHLFEDGVDLRIFSDLETAVDIVKTLLGEPEKTYKLRQTGQKKALQQHSGPTKVAHLNTILKGEQIADHFHLRHEPRCAREVIGLAATLQRVRLYDAIQELHRCHPVSRVVVGAGVDPKVIGDLADLPRLERVRGFAEETNAATTAQMKADDVESQVHTTHSLQHSLTGTVPTAVMLTVDEATDQTLDQVARASCVECVILTDARAGAVGHAVAERTAALARHGFQLSDPLTPTFMRSVLS